MTGRNVLQLDGWFELVLAASVLIPALAGVSLEEAFGIPAWAVIAVGLALVPVGIGLMFATPNQSALMSVGAVNALGAGVFAAYLAWAAPDMAAYGVAVAAVATAGLVVLAVLELRLARRPGDSRLTSGQ